MCLTIAVLLTRCYKDPVYEAIVTCYYSVDGVEKGEPVEGCIINIGDENFYKPGFVANLEMMRDSVIADANGQYKTKFPYEGLLKVLARIEQKKIEYDIDETGDTLSVNEISIIHLGKGELRLLPNEVATLDVLLVKQD